MSSNKSSELIEQGYQKVFENFFINKKEEAILINGIKYKFKEILAAELKEDSFARTISSRVGKDTNRFGSSMHVGTTTMLISGVNIEIKTTREKRPFIVLKFLKLGIKRGVKKTSKQYREAYAQAQKCLTILQKIIKSKVENVSSVNVSAADEILKFKQLLDQGIITNEEFEKKKQELLK